MIAISAVTRRGLEYVTLDPLPHMHRIASRGLLEEKKQNPVHIPRQTVELCEAKQTGRMQLSRITAFTCSRSILKGSCSKDASALQTIGQVCYKINSHAG